MPAPKTPKEVGEVYVMFLCNGAPNHFFFEMFAEFWQQQRQQKIMSSKNNGDFTCLAIKQAKSSVRADFTIVEIEGF